MEKVAGGIPKMVEITAVSAKKATYLTFMGDYKAT